MKGSKVLQKTLVILAIICLVIPLNVGSIPCNDKIDFNEEIQFEEKIEMNSGENINTEPGIKIYLGPMGDIEHAVEVAEISSSQLNYVLGRNEENLNSVSNCNQFSCFINNFKALQDVGIIPQDFSFDKNANPSIMSLPDLKLAQVGLFDVMTHICIGSEMKSRSYINNSPDTNVTTLENFLSILENRTHVSMGTLESFLEGITNRDDSLIYTAFGRQSLRRRDIPLSTFVMRGCPYSVHLNENLQVVQDVISFDFYIGTGTMWEYSILTANLFWFYEDSNGMQVALGEIAITLDAVDFQLMYEFIRCDGISDFLNDIFD